jgi:hypothetical protein
MRLLIIFACLILSNCVTIKEYPCPWEGVDISMYQSSIDTTFNYLEDAVIVFPNTAGCLDD